MQLNKQGALSCKECNLNSMRGTKVATTEGQRLLSKLPECSAPKTPDDSLKAHVHSPYIPLPMCKHNVQDIMTVCFPFLVGKPCACTGELCQLAHAPAGVPTK